MIKISEVLVIFTIVVGGLLLIAGSVGLLSHLALGIIVIGVMLFYLYRKSSRKPNISKDEVRA